MPSRKRASTTKRQRLIDMDFGDLFWIIPLLYVLKRVFFGSRKPDTAKTPSTREPRQPRPQRAQSQKSREELQEALGEIGLALGFPASMMQETGSQKESVEIADYASAPSMSLDTGHGPGRKAGMDRGTSLFPIDPVSEETIAYDAWQERTMPETIYATDALFAEEESFEKRRSDQARGHKNKNPDAAAAEYLSPYERPKAPGHTLRRLVARTPLQEAVAMKEILDRPVSLRRRSVSPFRT